jgi:rhamnosyltransferase
MKPTVSIVVLTRNAGPEFCQLLERVTTQRDRRPEIVVVDSGSSDGTPDLARRFGAKVIDIPAASFNHGQTRNLGIQHSQGEICVLLVQDALPVDDQWLENLTGHFHGDPLICGVTTRQVPRSDADMVVRWEVLRHNNSLGGEVKIRSIADWAAFERLPLQDRFFMCNFDNVCSAVRRSTWETHPFRSMPFAEDLDWAVRVLRAGHKIVYEPAAVVIHSHARSGIYHLRRHYVSAKIVPVILECPVPGVFADNDDGMFRAVNVLIQEALSLFLVVGQEGSSISHTEWHRRVNYVERAGLDHANGTPRLAHLAQRCVHKLLSWLPLSKRFKSVTKWSTDRRNPMRAHFFFLLSEIVQDAPDLDAATVRHLIVHSLARSIGHFLGGYYLWSDRLSRVSPGLGDLDRFLCLGV